jgi:hypothetical protein
MPVHRQDTILLHMTAATGGSYAAGRYWPLAAAQLLLLVLRLWQEHSHQLYLPYRVSALLFLSVARASHQP